MMVTLFIPISPQGNISRLVTSIVVLLPVLIALRALVVEGQNWRIPALLGSLYIIVAVVASIFPDGPTIAAFFFTAMIFFSFIAYRLLVRLLNARIVTYDEVFGGIDIYLLLGIIWALANMIIYTLDPASFQYSIHQGTSLNFFDFLIYSNTNIAGLGYSGIVPISNTALTLYSIEGLVGVLYIAIFVARLIGSMMMSSRP